jgi:hypothetical protein
MLAAARGWRHYRRTEGGSYYGESVRQLPSRDFNETLEKVDHLIAAAQPHGIKSVGVTDYLALSTPSALDFSGTFP